MRSLLGMTTLSSLATMAALTTATVVPQQAIAQEDDLREEIVVTARRKEEGLQEVPMAVSAIDGELIAELSVQNVTDLFGRVPGLYFTTVGGASANSDFQYLQIRGVGFNGGLEPAVGVFVDGMYMPQVGFDLGFLDVERVEVLRGPQGTLFGRNTQAGALNIVTKRPGDVTTGRVEAEFAEFGTWRLRGAVSGALSDNFFAGINVQYGETEGYIDGTVNGQDFGFAETFAARANLRFEPSDELTFTFILDATNSDFLDPGASVALVSSNQDYISLQDQDTDDTKDTFGAQLNIEWDISDSMSLTSLTGFRTVESLISYDPDLGISDMTAVTFGPVTQSTSTPTVPISVAPNPITLAGTTHLTGLEQDFFSQEFQLSGSRENLDWLAGLYYFDQATTQSRAFDIGPGIPFFPLYIRELFTEDRDGYAAYGQFNYSFNDRWDLTLGGRYSDEDVVKGGERVLNIFDAVIFAFPVPGSSSDDNFSLTGSLAFQATDDVNLYLTIAEGWKAGGINRFPSRDNAILPYDSEQSTNIELGIKSQFADGRVTLNAALYTIDIEGQQVLTVVPDPGGATPVTIIDNAADSTSSGIEIELTAQLVDNLDLGLAFSSTQTEFDNYFLNDGAGNPVVDKKGDEFDFVPNEIISATVGYTVPAGFGDMDLNLAASYQYIGGYTVPDGSFIDAPLGARNTLPSYDFVDFRATLRNDDWRVTAYVKNVGDKFNYNNLGRGPFTAVAANSLHVSPLNPRQVGLIVSRSF